jgi:DnaK suppressor protein
MAQSRLDEIRAQLKEDLRNVERQLAEYGVGPGSEGLGVSVDEGFADSAAATAERSEMLSMVGQLQASRDEIRAALDRFEAGTYGKCERCGRDIPIERLEARRTARLCVSCAQRENH